MKTQKEIIKSLAKQAGGFSKLAELIDVPPSRVSEWHNEKHSLSLPTFLLMVKKLNLNLEINPL